MQELRTRARCSEILEQLLVRLNPAHIISSLSPSIRTSTKLASESEWESQRQMIYEHVADNC